MAEAVQIADADALLRVIAESTTDVVFVRDLAGRYVLLNAAAAAANGVTVDELLGKDDSLLFPPDVVREIREDDRRTVEAGVTRTFERTLTPRGEARTYHVTKGPCRDRAGNIFGVFVISRDITERKRGEDERTRLFEREHALREEADRARLAAESAAGALGVLDQITEAALASLDLDDLLQTLVRRIKDAFAVDTVALVLLDEESRELVLRAAVGLDGALACGVRFAVGRGIAGRILAERRPVTIDTLRAEDLASPHLLEHGVRSLMGAPLRYPDRALGVVHVGAFAPRQFTEAEATLLLLAADRIAVAIEHARLYEEVRRANQARDEMLGIVAHDLRTPLNAIVLYAQLMATRMKRDAERPVAERAPVESILASARHMDRLVQDLLDVTRIEAGELSVELAPLGVEPIIEEAVEFARPLASGKSLHLETRVAAGIPEVRADKHRLLQLLGNLVGNAVKFTDDGGAITVAAEHVGADVQISVSDTGPGIRKEHLPHIFNRFWRATASDRRNTGLGLSIAEGLAKRHDGRIWVESTFGAGSTFFVAIPVAR